MKVLVIEECHYTRLGILESLKENTDILSMGVISICDAINTLPTFHPDVVLVNSTQYGCYSEYCIHLQSFISLVSKSRLYFYINKPYPLTKFPIQLTNKDFILSKKSLPTLIDHLKKIASPVDQHYFSHFNTHSSIFSYQENRILYYWMLETNTHKTAQILNISNSTVYSHKRHIIEKMGVSNQIELVFIYNIFKYVC
ncbi:LuxR C-terminal-related transcriptional regulator [Xenorhabdus szentirmaii]|uniref:LuxR C-terminal-related transcriptional regulator n=1 Tax=Xenorhabdus szentirmaii TaxID=290112 RepID=UPI0032B86C30